MDTKNNPNNYVKRLVRSRVLSLETDIPHPAPSGADIVRLSANENNFGTPPQVLAALRAHLEDGALNRYPEGTCIALREALSHEFQLPPDWFMVGNGLDDIVGLLGLTFLEPEDEVILPAVTYPVYEKAAHFMGAKPVVVPMKPDLSIDVDAMTNAVTSRTKMIFLCNPNNPTGTIVHRAEFDRLVGRLEMFPLAPLLVADQAYIDYVDPHEDYLNAINYTQDHRNVIVLRTFSQISGLAGLRIAYAIAHPELLAYLYRVKFPYAVNALAQVAATVDIRDPEVLAFKDQVKRAVQAGREELESFFRERGVQYVPSYANFTYALYDKAHAELQEIANRLATRNISVCVIHREDTGGGIRFTIGTPEENARLIEALRDIL